MKKIIILGSTDMAGHLITNYLTQLNKYEIINVSRSKLNENTILIDAYNINSVEKLLNEKKPKVVINCIGVLIKESERFPDRAIYINSFFPRYLESLGKELNFKLIHLSTDCVFSGKNGDYSENDLKDASDIYGRSKALGEVMNNKDLTFRTSFIGPDQKDDGQGLFNWFMTQTGMINGFINVLWTGVTSLELAKAVNEAIIQNLTGLYHLVPSKRISKYELLMLIKEIWGKTIEIHKDSQQQSDKSLINTKKDFKYEVPDYQVMLRELFEWMKDWEYPHYKIPVH